jgi:hypothetical protein
MRAMPAASLDIGESQQKLPRLLIVQRPPYALAVNGIDFTP